MPVDGANMDIKSSIGGVSEASESTHAQLYADTEERRLKEWANYQRSHRTEEDQDANRAFLDLSIDDVLVGRIVVELFEREAPQAVAQFRRLVTGALGVDEETGTKIDYLHTPVSCVDREKGYVRMGDLNAYGVELQHTQDDVFARRHNDRGLLTTLAHSTETTSTSFGITLRSTPSLDFHQLVFGCVIDGSSCLDKIETLALNAAGRPLNKVRIAFCGVLTGPQPPGVWHSTNTS